MKLVEVIAGRQTDQGLMAPMVDFVKSIEKTPVVVKDSPGFIVNRVARHYYLESLHLLEENSADIGTIDALLRSAGFKLGPFELMDLIGNDVNLEVSRLMYEAFDQTPRFKPSGIQEEKVRSGQLGRKTGKGYYDYEIAIKHEDQRNDQLAIPCLHAEVRHSGLASPKRFTKASTRP